MYFVKKNNNNNIWEEMSNFFNDNFKNTSRELKADISEDDKEYQIEVDVPGVDKKNITLNVEDDYLTISVKKEENKEDKNKKYIRRERYYEEASRSFYVGNINNENVKAKLDNGILTVTVPKKALPNESKFIQIE